MLDLALAEDLDTVFSALLLNSDEEAVGRMLRHPHSLVSLSDAGAHLTFFNDAGFGLHLLGHWVRETRGADARGSGRASSPAIRRDVFGIRDRGALEAGYTRRPAAVRPRDASDRGPKQRVHDLPGGGARLITAGDRRARRLGRTESGLPMGRACES